MKLPIVNLNETLESKSINELKSVFGFDLFEIRPRVERDKGVDLYIEAKDNNRYTNFELIVQLKATRTIKQNTDGSYSKSIETSNLHYLLNSSLSAIYAFYVDATGEIFYEWAETIYKNLKKTCDNIDTQDSYTVRFSKKLSLDSVNTIHQTILEKGYGSREKFEDSIPNTIKNQIWDNQGKHILDVLYDTIENIEISVLPTHYLPKLFPFAKNKEGGTFISDYTLYTDNEELFHFLDNIFVKRNKFSFKKESKKITQINNLDEKLKKVLFFIRLNLINHIRLVDSHNQRICIHKLVLKPQKCGCEKCSFERFDFTPALEKVNQLKEDNSLANKMKKAYVLYQLGYLKKAIQEFQNLSKELKKSKEYLPYFICLFNLKKLRIHIASKYFNDDRKEILADLKTIDLVSVLQEIRPMVNGFNYSILAYIEQESFISTSLWNVDETVEKAIDLYRSDQYGGWSSNNQSEKLGFHLTWIHRFLTYNFIIYDNFSDFSKVVNKSFEGFIAAHQLKNELNDNFNNFNDYLLTLLITYGNTKFLNKTFIRYNVKALKIENFKPKTFIAIVKRLCLSIDTIQLLIGNKDKARDNYFFREKINKIISNLFLLLSRLPLPKKQFNQTLEELIEFLPNAPFIYPTCKDYLKEMVTYKSNEISNDNYEKLLKLCVTHKRWRELSLIDKMVVKIHSSKSGFILSDKDLITNIFELTDKRNHTWTTVDLVIFWRIASVDFKKRIKSEIQSSLKNKFNSRLYFAAVMEEIINYEPLWNDFIKSVPKQPHETSFIEAFGGKDDFKIYRLNQLIDIAYKFEIDLNEEKYQKLHEGIPYYQWLLNLRKFDYSQFDPYWILKHQSFHYFRAFSKIPTLLEITKKSINENYNEGLAKIYLYHFAGVNVLEEK